MANNISKYVQLNDFLLLEYEFNRDGAETSLTGIGSYVAETALGNTEFFNSSSQGTLNNDLKFNSLPTTENRSSWFFDPDHPEDYYRFFDSSTLISQSSYPFDTVKVHIVSGYNFDDIPGFLLQIQAQDTSNNFVDLSNFTWVNQVLLGSGVLKFSPNALYLANRFYDKYVELKIPSVSHLAGQSTDPIESALNIRMGSDVYFTYSTISQLNDTAYTLDEAISLQLPTASQADNFNAFIAEGTDGDFIEFYATWNGIIIGEYMGDIESGRIPLYTSNNPNDNFEEFANTYGPDAQKWVIMHELYVYEHIPGATLLTQQYVFTQDKSFMAPNYFRPVIQNADIASSYTIEYICRLSNRMDGTQIIRKASFASKDPKKYGRYFERLNVDNYIPYKVFNRIEGEKSTNISTGSSQKPKFVKVYFDSTQVLLDMDNNVLPQGTGPLFLKRGDGAYLFKFEKTDKNAGNEPVNVDLSGAYQYALLFVLDDDTKIEISPTFSTNMNTTLGQLEFKIMEDQVNTLLSQTNNTYSIIIKNPDGTKYTFYEGVYFPYSNYQQVLSTYSSLFDINGLKEKISDLEKQNQQLLTENTTLKSK